MTKPKINYTIRPAKNVERKILADLLNCARNSYDISDYRYIGFGSIFFVDFILFHKSVWIKDMVSVEKFWYWNRLEFNRPYDFINVSAWQRFCDFLKLKSNFKSGKNLVWLDYECAFCWETRDDIKNFVWGVASAGDILFVTVNAWFDQDIKTQVIDAANEEGYMPHGTDEDGINQKTLPGLYDKIFTNIVSRQLPKNLKYRKMLNLTYKDGLSPMYSIWFIFDQDEEKLDALVEQLKRSDIGLKLFSEDILHITVPDITVKEAREMAGKIEELKRANPNDYATILWVNLDKDEVSDYLSYYKYHPVFIDWASYV